MRRPGQRLETRHVERTVRLPADQQIDIVAEVRAVDDLIRAVGLLVEIVAADEEVERTVEVGRNARFLGEGLEPRLADVSGSGFG